MAKILSTCHVAKNSKFEIWGTALHAVFLHVLPPPVLLTCSLKYRPAFTGSTMLRVVGVTRMIEPTIGRKIVREWVIE